MSTILKALQRLDREKSSPGGRPLQDEVAAAALAPSRRRLPVAAIGAAMAALGLGLGASMYWLWPRENAAPELAAAPSAPQGAALAQGMPSKAPAPPVLESRTPAAPVASAPPPAAFSSPVAVVERPEPPPVAEPEPAMPGEGVAETDVPAASAPLPGALPPFATRSGAAPAARSLDLARAEPPAPVARPVDLARSEPPSPAARSLDRARSEPLSATLSPAPPPAPVARRKPAPEKVVRANLPAVFVSSTVWHPQKDRRLARVTLEGGETRELHEGDAIGPLVVSEIEPSGVVFVHEGVEIRRKVGAKN